MTILDTNSTSEAMSIIVEMIDWKQAFDHQCPKLGIEAVIKKCKLNGKEIFHPQEIYQVEGHKLQH